MLAYWEQALDIGDPNVLRSLATELGLDCADGAIEGNLHGPEVALATAQAQSAGIDAIPGFLLDRRLIVLGAQPDEAFTRAFAQLGATERVDPAEA